MSTRKTITVEEFFKESNSSNGLIEINHFLKVCYKNHKKWISDLEKGFNVFSQENIQIQFYVNTNNHYQTKLELTVFYEEIKDYENFSLPYIEGLEELVNFQPDFKFHDILIYLYDHIDWNKMKPKLRRETMKKVDEYSDEQLYWDLVGRDSILAQDNDCDDILHELEYQIQMEELMAEKASNDFYNELIIEQHLVSSNQNDEIMSELEAESNLAVFTNDNSHDFYN